MFQQEITQNKIWNRGDQEQFELGATGQLIGKTQCWLV
jgi:hypothetical protein